MKRFIFFILLYFLSVSSGYAEDRVETFVSIPPQKWVVDKVGGKHVNTGVLVGKGQDPHTFEPTPKQIAALSRADIWFTTDMEFESHLIKKIQQINPGLLIVDMAHDIDTDIADHSDEHEEHHDIEKHDDHDEHGDHKTHGHHEDHKDDKGHKDHGDHADHKAHDEHEGHGDHAGHDHGESDLHVWLSPVNLMSMAAEVAEKLSETDSSHSSAYSANLNSVKKELGMLHEKIKSSLAPYKGRSFYVYHPSFGHFAHTYGLQQQAVEMGGKSPTPKQLSKLIKRARSENVRVIFVQPQFDPKSAVAVANAIGGEVVPLDALDENIAENLEVMASKIVDALSR